MSRVNISSAEVGIYSFCADTKSPQANVEFDLNSFRDPLGHLPFRKKCSDGTDPRVKEWIKVDPRYEAILEQVIILVKDHQNSGGKWLSVGFRDYHGTWKSRAVAELICDELVKLGFCVGVMHARGIEGQD